MSVTVYLFLKETSYGKFNFLVLSFYKLIKTMNNCARFCNYWSGILRRFVGRKFWNYLNKLESLKIMVEYVLYVCFRYLKIIICFGGDKCQRGLRIYDAMTFIIK